MEDGCGLPHGGEDVVTRTVAVRAPGRPFRGPGPDRGLRAPACWPLGHARSVSARLGSCHSDPRHPLGKSAGHKDTRPSGSGAWFARRCLAPTSSGLTTRPSPAWWCPRARRFPPLPAGLLLSAGDHIKHGRRTNVSD